jgi:tetratricopeptide (TPR) repeat protein
LKSKTDVEVLENVIWERKFKALESLITRANNPKTSVMRILNAMKLVNVMLYVKHYKHVAKVIDMAISYLPNFNEQLFIDELIYFGNAHLELTMFKESKKYFNEVLQINELNVQALWGIVKANSRCSRDIDVIDKEINLIKHQEYNLLINTLDDTTYYTDIYHHIKQRILPDDKLLEISQKTVGFEERFLAYHKKTR